VKANYAFSWKTLGSVDGRLYGVFLKATNHSAFWYDLRRFQRDGLQPPTSWTGLQRLSDTLVAKGLKPFAVGGSSSITLPDLFANVYLMLQGNRSYDALSRGTIRWTDPSVRDVLRTLRSVLVNPDRIAGGLESLRTDYPSAVQKVFGSPQRAGMVAGGSAVLPVLYTAKAARPIQQFGAFPFPTADGRASSRVIGEGDAAVMVEDSPQARALVSFLATPAAATIWAKRGGDFLSPNRAVDLGAYATPAMRTLATALTRASVFRFGIAAAKPAAFATTLNRMLIDYIRHPSQVSRITAQIDAVAPKA
jgi:ABC-type glycerol-3-phosphate transport system substrate-binding protein